MRTLVVIDKKAHSDAVQDRIFESAVAFLLFGNLRQASFIMMGINVFYHKKTTRFYRAITLPEIGMRVRESSTKEIASVVWSSSPNANNANNAWNINFNNGNTNNNNRNNNSVRLVRSGE